MSQKCRKNYVEVNIQSYIYDLHSAFIPLMEIIIEWLCCYAVMKFFF